MEKVLGGALRGVPVRRGSGKNATVERAETRAVFVARGRLSPAKVLYAEFSKDFRLLKSREERKFRTQGRLSPTDYGD